MKSDKRTQIAFILEEALNYFVSLFVTATMLGYILDTLGFSDATQGVISTVATFTSGAQLISLFLTGRRVKKIITVSYIINQLSFAALYLLPIFNIPSGLKTALLLVLLFAGHIIGNAVTPVRLTWLMSSVENEKRGTFTAIKEMISLAGGIAVSVSFGAVADTFRDASGMPTRPYYIICAVALLVMMVLHTVTLLISVEKPLPYVKIPKIRETLGGMVHSPTIIKVIGVSVLWNITFGFSTSFFASYLREELSFSFTVIALFSTLGSICRIAASPLLGKIGDKYSFATSMTISFTAAALAFIFMIFTAPSTKWLYIGFISLYSFAWAGINSGVLNLVYDYVAPIGRTTAMSIQNAFSGIIGFVSALIAGKLLENIQSRGGIVLFGVTVYAQQVLSLVSAVLSVVVIVYMIKVIKPLKRVDNDAEEEVKKIIEKARRG